MNLRNLEFTDFNAVRTELDRLQRGGYEQAGTWDLAQVCNHLSYFMTGSLDGHQFKVPWILKALLGRLVLRRILKNRKMKRGVFTPQKPLPEPGGDEAPPSPNSRRRLLDLRSHKGEFIDSPFFGHLTPDQRRELHLIHAGHHLGYLIPKRSQMVCHPEAAEGSVDSSDNLSRRSRMKEPVTPRAEHRLTAGSLQQRHRRFGRQGQRSGRDEVGMLQRVAAAQDRMAARIRHRKPNAARRELPDAFRQRSEILHSISGDRESGA